MKLWSIEGNSQKLDGGSMFGNAPRTMWTKWATPDDLNRIRLATRALLATPLNGKTVLFETGIGAFFEPKMRERFGVVEAGHVLLDNLAAAGFAHEDIDTDQSHQIPSQVQMGREFGMQMLDQALLAAVQAKEIDPDNAYAYATDKRVLQKFVTDTSLLPKLDPPPGSGV